VANAPRCHGDQRNTPKKSANENKKYAGNAKKSEPIPLAVGRMHKRADPGPKQLLRVIMVHIKTME
jgi:hypothetical protein